MANSPDQSAASGDPGDDTARRYQYQWTYAAILCCLLLDDTEDVAEVLCEHHEDVLLKHADATFSGVQLKTRDSDQPLWTTSDKGVRASFAKFVLLESQFPGRFGRFRFLTNHPLQSTKNGKDICHTLEMIRAAASLADLGGPFLKFLSRVAREAGCTQEIAFTALRKSTASADLPKRHDIEARLVATLLPVWTKAQECSLAAVQKAATRLVTECGRASSLGHEGLLPAYLPASATPDTAQRMALDFKTFSRARVEQALLEGFSSTALLDGDTTSLVAGSSGSPALLRAKLEAGGFSITSIHSAADLRDKADHLALVWTKKHGNEQGLQRLAHIRSVVLRDAASAFEDARVDDRRFGVQMLQALRRGIDARRQRPDAQLHDCSNEHLEGFAFVLTSECTVRWSMDSPWEQTDESR